jgi:DNA ligase-1
MQSITKPMLAKDIEESKLKFPLTISPKIDGVFAFVQNGQLYARSLKQHENLFTTSCYSDDIFNGLRGELIVGNNPTAEDLCRNTGSGVRRIQGEPETSLWCFDYVLPSTEKLSYDSRIKLLALKVQELNLKGFTSIKMIPVSTVQTMQEYLSTRDEYLQMGYEGCIVRDPSLPHKEGRSSSTKAHLWRYKPYATAEIRVTSFVEEMHNLNEAKTNELGRTERSTNQENLVGKGNLGAIVGTLVTPLLDCYSKEIAAIGTELTIATGSLTDKERKYYWSNPAEMIDHVVEFEYMSFGLKDKPRFAQFKCIRSEINM